MASAPRAQSTHRFRDPAAAALGARIEPIVQAHGLLLEELELNAGSAQTVLRVVVDLADGTDTVDLDTIAAVSDDISTRLDEDDPLPDHESYDLEVSTPGATRPLTEARHYRRNVGRLLEIERTGQPTVTARLLDAGSEDGIDAITVSVQKPAPKKGMPVKYGEPEDFALADITRARVQVEFSHGENDPRQQENVSTNPT